MAQGLHLRREAEALSGPLPSLLASAEHLAASVVLGAHGRRRAGIGDEFWQYRPAHVGDTASAIDWRRSARSETAHFVREKEWQAAQTVDLWVDAANSMNFASSDHIHSKGDRARLIGLAAAILLIRAGERVGMTSRALAPRSGEVQLTRLADILGDVFDPEDYGAPDATLQAARSRALFISDFLGDIDAIEETITVAADRGVRGALLQILDPVEEAFPFDGRTRFESMTGALEFETQKAGNLRQRYIERLDTRKARLRALADETGWFVSVHHTDAPPLSALLWAYHALEPRR